MFLPHAKYIPQRLKPESSIVRLCGTAKAMPFQSKTSHILKCDCPVFRAGQLESAEKGVYHINAVDAVTQWEVVGSTRRILEREYLLYKQPEYARLHPKDEDLSVGPRGKAASA